MTPAENIQKEAKEIVRKGIADGLIKAAPKSFPTNGPKPPRLLSESQATVYADIKSLVAQFFQVDVAWFDWNSRGPKRVAYARMVAQFFCLKLIPHSSYSECAEAFNRADHSIISHSVATVKESLLKPTLAHELAQCQEFVLSKFGKIKSEQQEPV